MRKEIFALAIGLLIGLLWMPIASAETQAFYNVNNTADVGDANIGDGICDSSLVLAGEQCTLRAAVDEANYTNTADFIDLPAGIYALSSSLTLKGDVQISGSGIIDGGDQYAISGGGEIGSIGDITFFGPTLRNLTGLNCSRNSFCSKLTLLLTTVESSSGQDGGAVHIYADELHIEESTLNDNSASNNGGAIWARVDKVTILRSTISGNSAGNIGGGIYIWPRGTNDFEMLIDETTIDGNSAEQGGGIYITNIGNAASVTKDIVIEQSTLSNNDAVNPEQNLAHGGGLYVWSDVTLVNSTVSGNSANEHGGGIYLFSGSLALYSSTITNNTADSDVGNDGDGGGLAVGSGTATLYRTVLAANDDNTDGIVDLFAPDCSGTIESGGNNLIGLDNFNCTFNGHVTDQIGSGGGIDPQLNALANNGGLTQNHMPINGSPLVNAGGACLGPDGNALSGDQRGLARVQQGICDIGAVESTFGTPTAVTVGAISAETSSPLPITLLLLTLITLLSVTWQPTFSPLSKH